MNDPSNQRLLCFLLLLFKIFWEANLFDAAVVFYNKRIPVSLIICVPASKIVVAKKEALSFFSEAHFLFFAGAPPQ